MRSSLVSTPIVRSPFGSTSPAIWSPSEFAMSWERGSLGQSRAWPSGRWHSGRVGWVSGHVRRKWAQYNS
eukprot:3497391-Rhodomonas_salina.2